MAGTSGNDSITITESAGPTADERNLTVSRNGTYTETFTVPTDAGGTEILLSSLEGNDNINLSGVTSFPVSLQAGDGNDTVRGTSQDDTIDGGAGTDSLRGENGNDLIFGGDNNDTISGGAGADVISGGAGGDLLEGASGADTINGDNGNDVINGMGNDDVIFGDAGNDSVQSGSGNDVIYGGNGADTLKGSDGSDAIFGDSGNDSIFGHNGADTLDGGLGTNQVNGGSGTDLFSIEGDNNAGTHAFARGSASNKIDYTHTSGSQTARIDVLTHDSFDMILLLALGGNDTVSVASNVAIGGTLDGGDGNDDDDVDPAVASKWTLENF